MVFAALLFATAPCKDVGLELDITPYDQTSALKRPYLREQTRMTIRINNRCPGGDVLPIGWSVSANDEAIANGTTPLAPQTGVEMHPQWMPRATGTYTIRATGNDRTIERTIEIQPYDTQQLSFAKAHEAKAVFGSTSGPSLACVADALEVADASVRIEATCNKNGSFDGEIRAFDNFSLKNAWRVKSVEAVKPERQSENASITPTVLPGASGESTLMKFHAAAAPGASAFMTYVVTIEGPKGLDPYK